MSDQLDKLLKKKEQLNSKIAKVKAAKAAQEKKDDTRRKILWGALVMRLIDSGQLDEDKWMNQLEQYLTRDSDRKLFGFPLKKS